MNKQEFIDKLRISLNSQLAPTQVAEHMRYYEDYINMEIRKGRAESDVMQSLGDPRLIARSIVDATDVEDDQQSYGGSSYSDYRYGRSGSSGAYGAGAGGNATYRNASNGSSYNTNSYGGSYQQEVNDSSIWNKRLGRFTVSKWLWIIFGILVIFLIVSAILSLVSFLMPILVPIFIIVFITKLFRDWLN